MGPKQTDDVRECIRNLQQRLDEAEETLRALRGGEVDAIVASGPEGDRVYTLKGADEPYRVIVQGMAEGALTLTADGLILFSNEQFAGIVRRPLERVIGARFQDFVTPEDMDVVCLLLAATYSRKAEVQLRTDEAGAVPVYLSIENLLLGEVESLCVIVTDLSEQKRNQEIAAVMEAVPAAVFIAHDMECREIRGNRMAYRLLGSPHGSNVSESASEHNAPGTWRAKKDGRRVPPEELPMQTAARSGEPVHDYELDVILDDGTSRCWLGNAVPLFDETGRSRGAVGAFVDITERKHAEERLQQTQKLESIGLLAGGIAHDFNNLLVGVIGNASLAQDMLPPRNPVVKLLDEVIKGGEQLANLTRQMLAYAGKGRFFLERLDLSELIPEMSGLIQPAIPKNIALHFELGRHLPQIDADRGQMQQVFMNLVINAAEAIGGDAGLISVTTGVRVVDKAYIRRNPEAAELSTGEYLYLEVSDTGCGLDAATRMKIFDPFFTTKFTGRGLGLAAVSGIVRGHKGMIEVLSEPGKGSRFTVLLPAAQGAMPARQVTEEHIPQNVTGTVLVVDDEEVVRDMAMTTLRRHGFEVFSANSGLEAIDMAKSLPGEISLIVLDLSMPGMSGAQALPEIQKLRPGIKIIVSSGYNEVETMALFKGQAVAGFIQKPYTSKRLAEKVKLALGDGQ